MAGKWIYENEKEKEQFILYRTNVKVSFFKKNLKNKYFKNKWRKKKKIPPKNTDENVIYLKLKGPGSRGGMIFTVSDCQ